MRWIRFSESDFELAWVLRPQQRTWRNSKHEKELCKKILVDGLPITRVAESIDWSLVQMDKPFPESEALKIRQKRLTELVKELEEQIFPTVN